MPVLSALAPRRPRETRALLVALALIAAAAVVLPIVVTVVQAFQGGGSAFRSALETSSSRTLLVNTVLVALVATPICAVFGVGAAWFVERTRLPGRRIWALLLVAPLTVPLFVTSYAWATLGVALQGFLGAAGIIAFSYYPIVFLLVAVALRGLDPALEETARSLGLNGRQIFFRVVLPQLRPGAARRAPARRARRARRVRRLRRAEVPDVLLRHLRPVPARLQQLGRGRALVLLDRALRWCCCFGEARLRGRRELHARQPGGAAGSRTLRARRAGSCPVLAGFGGVVAVSVGIPSGCWSTGSRQSSQAGAFGREREPPLPLARDRDLGRARRQVRRCSRSSSRSRWPCSSCADRGPLARLLERATYLAFALPDLVAAIALSYAAVHYARSALRQLHADRLRRGGALPAVRRRRAARDASARSSRRSRTPRGRSGSGALRTFGRVTVPLARPGIIAAVVLVFAFSLGDLATAQVLLPLNLYTLGTEFDANSSTVAFAAAAPFAAVLIVLAMGAAYVLMSRFGEVRALGEERGG